MNKAKHALLAAIMGVCLLFSGMALVACGSNDEQVIRDSIASELDVIKNHDTEAMTAMLEGEDDTIAALEQMGVSADDFFNNFFDGFDYEITDVTIDGDNATASVILTCKSEKDFEAAFEEAVSGDLENIITMTEDEAMKYVGTAAMDTLSKLEPKQSDPITISLSKTNGEWKEDASTTLKVMNAMLAM